jgi:hypothetical protein
VGSKPIAFEVGTTAPEMMLFPNNKEPEPGSPSMSTGAATETMQ